MKEIKLNEHNKYDMGALLVIMKYLRSENGCPWDREQTHKSIRQNLLEECYEAVEAIDTSDTALLREELGDVLLQVVFHSEISNENGEFVFEDVVHDLCDKLITRHPHVFGDVKVSNSEEVLDVWNAVKKETKGQKTLKETCESISKALPALMRNQKLRKKLNKIEFNFNNTIDISVKFDTIDKCSIGNALASIVSIAEANGISAEEALSEVTEECIKNL